jgi:hypothetical protein
MKIPPLLIVIVRVYAGLWYWLVPGALHVDIPVAVSLWLAWRSEQR